MTDRISKTILPILLAFMAPTAAYAGNPPPPPSVPVGGPGVTIITVAVIAGYGIWKARK